MNYENRQYLIFPVTELANINFDEVLETSADTVRKSVDSAKTFVKWENEMPASVAGITQGTEGPYTHDEILAILSTEEWTQPFNLEP
jgi:hypothetical protein